MYLYEHRKRKTSISYIDILVRDLIQSMLHFVTLLSLWFVADIFPSFLLKTNSFRLFFSLFDAVRLSRRTAESSHSRPTKFARKNDKNEKNKTRQNSEALHARRERKTGRFETRTEVIG